MISKLIQGVDAEAPEVEELAEPEDLSLWPWSSWVDLDPHHINVMQGRRRIW